MSEWIDDVRWFDLLGLCRECNAPGIGKLMDSRNTNMGVYCQRCAVKRLTKAAAAREKAGKP